MDINGYCKELVGKLKDSEEFYRMALLHTEFRFQIITHDMYYINKIELDIKLGTAHTNLAYIDDEYYVAKFFIYCDVGLLYEVHDLDYIYQLCVVSNYYMPSGIEEVELKTLYQVKNLTGEGLNIRLNTLFVVMASISESSIHKRVEVLELLYNSKIKDNKFSYYFDFASYTIFGYNTLYKAMNRFLLLDNGKDLIETVVVNVPIYRSDYRSEICDKVVEFYEKYHTVALQLNNTHIKYYFELFDRDYSEIAGKLEGELNKLISKDKDWVILERIHKPTITRVKIN